MATGAKKFMFVDEQDEKEVEVHYMVGRSEEEDYISIEKDGMGCEELGLDAAQRLADTIRRMGKWRMTTEAQKKISRLRKKEYPDG